MLTPCIAELVDVASLISSAHILCMVFTLSGLSLVPFMHAGKTPLPVNYWTGGSLQLMFTCSFVLGASLPSCMALPQPASGI